MSEFRSDNELGKALRDWWVGLEQNKGDRAALRRCGKLSEVAFIGAYHKLWFDLAPLFEGKLSRESLLPIAALIAQVRLGDSKTDTGASEPLPVQMARSASSGREAAVSELRFRRLLQCQNREELFVHLRRVIRLLDSRVDIYGLANAVCWWSDPIRKRWAYAYYEQLNKN